MNTNELLNKWKQEEEKANNKKTSKGNTKQDMCGIAFISVKIMLIKYKFSIENLWKTLNF